VVVLRVMMMTMILSVHKESLVLGVKVYICIEWLVRSEMLSVAIVSLYTCV